jgi:hypothetical protein
MTEESEQATRLKNQSRQHSWRSRVGNMTEEIRVGNMTEDPEKTTRLLDTRNRILVCKIWGFNDGYYEELRLLGCYAVWFL